MAKTHYNKLPKFGNYLRIFGNFWEIILRLRPWIQLFQIFQENLLIFFSFYLKRLFWSTMTPSLKPVFLCVRICLLTVCSTQQCVSYLFIQLSIHFSPKQNWSTAKPENETTWQNSTYVQCSCNTIFNLTCETCESKRKGFFKWYISILICHFRQLCLLI